MKGRLLVTGADGFVGRWLVRAARGDGWQVLASILPGSEAPAEWSENGSADPVEVTRADLRDDADLARLAATAPDALIHLAAIASGSAARRDPAEALRVNSTGAGLLAEQLAQTSSPRFLLVSSAEVYGGGYGGPIRETSPRRPVSPYGTSKAEAELALLEAHDRVGLPVIVARAFPHTGPGQSATYVLPALTERLREARRTGRTSIPVGNLDAIRDFLDVRDVVRAYLLLIAHGEAGEIYNVASGTGRRLADCFDKLARIIGVEARPEPDAALLRSDDIPALIGDPAKLKRATGWHPAISFEQTLQDLVNAQAH